MDHPALSPHALLAAVDARHVWQPVDDGPSLADVGDAQVDVTAEVRAAERAGLIVLGAETAGGRRWRLTTTGETELARLASGAARAEPDGPMDAGVRYLAELGLVTTSRPEGPLAPVLRMLHRRAVAAAQAHQDGDRHDDVVTELYDVVMRLRDGEGEAA